MEAKNVQIRNIYSWPLDNMGLSYTVLHRFSSINTQENFLEIWGNLKKFTEEQHSLEIQKKNFKKVCYGRMKYM